MRKASSRALRPIVREVEIQRPRRSAECVTQGIRPGQTQFRHLLSTPFPIGFHPKDRVAAKRLRPESVNPWVRVCLFVCLFVFAE